MELSIIGSNLKWNNNYECKNLCLGKINQRREIYDTIVNFLDDLEPCEYSNYIKLDKNSSIRIGSESRSAEVFLIKIKMGEKEENIAVKVLPIMNKNSIEKNENEMRIALNASTLVLEGSSEHFPLVYFFDECPDTEFYNNKYNIESKTFQKSDKIKSHILISELFKEDLYTFLLNNSNVITKEEWLIILNQCLVAINDLHFKLNVVHNDLHLKNFLINSNSSDFLIVIHDFGTSHFVSEDEIKLYNYDILDKKFFFESVLELEDLGIIIPNDVKFWILSILDDF